MYREQWVADILGERSVLSVALDVHMTVTGSTERNPDEQERDIKALREIVSTWDNRFACEFDEAVLSLVNAAIKESET
jgi:hypothetical protein